MIRVTNVQVVAFLNASAKLEDVELDNERGGIAADLHAACTLRQIGFQYRARALEKERKKAVEDNVLKDARGNKRYGEAPDGKPENRPLLWRNRDAWDRAFAALEAKVDALNEQVVEIALEPVRDDFFTKPDVLTVKHAIRIGFQPFMASAQAARNGGAPKKKAKK